MRWELPLRRVALLVGITLSALGGATVTGTDRKLPTNYTNLETLDEKTRCMRADDAVVKWQRKLRLQGYDLDVICGIPEEWKRDHDASAVIYGASNYDVTHLVGRVWINPGTTDKDVELVVIHELLHALVNEAIGSNSLMVQERVVYTLAELVYLGRDK